MNANIDGLTIHDAEYWNDGTNRDRSEEIRTAIVKERAEELQAEVDRLRQGIEKLIPWAQTYQMHHVVVALRDLLDK